MGIFYCLMIVFSSFPLFFQNKISADQLLPDALRSYKPSISQEEYLKIHGSLEAKKEKNLISLGYEVNLILNTDEIEDLVLYFHKETKDSVYKYIIRYKNKKFRDAFTQKDDRNPNQGKQCIWTLGKIKGPFANAWTVESSLVLAIE